MSKELFLGIDVGSITIKTAVLDGDAKLLSEAYLRIKGDPLKTLLSQLQALSLQFPDSSITAAGITGSGGKQIAATIGALFINEINTIPGSMAFYLWEASGVPFPELLDRLLSSAIEHARVRRSLTFSLERNLLADGHVERERVAVAVVAQPPVHRVRVFVELVGERVQLHRLQLTRPARFMQPPKRTADSKRRGRERRI